MRTRVPAFDAPCALHVLSRLRPSVPLGEIGMSKILGRRQFTFGVAVAAATSLGLPADMLAQTVASAQPLDAQSLDAGSLDKKTRAAMAKLSASAQAEVEMKVASIFRRYGDRLSEEQKADIRRIMAEGQEGLEKMRAYRLENGDQPADAFRAYSSEENAGHKLSGHETGKTTSREEKK